MVTRFGTAFGKPSEENTKNKLTITATNAWWIGGVVVWRNPRNPSTRAELFFDPLVASMPTADCGGRLVKARKILGVTPYTS